MYGTSRQKIRNYKFFFFILTNFMFYLSTMWGQLIKTIIKAEGKDQRPESSCAVTIDAWIDWMAA